MSETTQPNPELHPGEEKFVQDPVQAELMAYAEKPHREYAIALRDTANGEITDLLEGFYQENPDYRHLTWEQERDLETDPKYRQRENLLSEKEEFLDEAKQAIGRGELAAMRASMWYRQKEPEPAVSVEEKPKAVTYPEQPFDNPKANDKKERPGQNKEGQTHTGVARLSRSNMPVYGVNEEELIRKTEELVESGE